MEPSSLSEEKWKKYIYNKYRTAVTPWNTSKSNKTNGENNEGYELNNESLWMNNWIIHSLDKTHLEIPLQLEKIKNSGNTESK